MTTLRNASDAYVAQAKPEKNFSKTRRLYLADAAANNTRYAYLYWGLPSGLVGSNVSSAKIQIHTGTGWGGSVTMSLQRLAEKFSVNRVKWSNKPGVTGAAKTAVKTGGNNTLWEFDVTDLMQQVADGGKWFGFRVSATNSTTKFIYSAEAADDLRPLLIIEYSDAPQAPENVKPDDGKAVSVAKPTLRWDFIDEAGDTTQQSFNLRLFSSQALAEANAPGDLLDVVNKAGTLPQVDLDDTTYGGTAADAQVWGRLQVTDGAGLTSGWSEIFTWKRVTKGTLNITNPAAGGTPFVNEATPPFSWTFTGRTQETYEVILTTPETPEEPLWTSGMVTSTDVAVTPPEGVITEVGKTYRLIVRIWDTIDRQEVPDDKAYVEATRDFVFQLSSSVGVVSNLTGTSGAVRPEMTLEWDDATAPDGYVLIRDDETLAEFQPSELLVAGTHYRLIDRDAAPRKQHTWSIARRVNAATSADNPTVTGKVKAVTTMISDVDGGREVFFLNPDVAAEKAESSEIQYLLGDAPPVMISQSIRGYEGSISGVLVNDYFPDLSAEQQLKNLEWFRKRRGVPVRMVWVDKVMRVVIRNITDTPIGYPDGTVEYLASFDFFQVD